MGIFESLENLNVSEECFNDILNIVEGIMDDIKAGISPEEAKKKFVDKRNKEYKDAVKRNVEVKRLARKAEDKVRRGQISADTYLKLDREGRKADKDTMNRTSAQAKINFTGSKSTRGKMLLPTFKEVDGAVHQVGFKKGG